jgi:ATP-binding cassette subfamily F protein uup
MSAPNVLILYEPTNDLAVQTRSVLEEYLEDFNGCVITVSHDRYFLDRVVERIFAFEGEGVVRQYPGNYSLYLDFKQAEEAEEKEAALQREKTQKVKQEATKPVESKSSSPPKASSSRPRKLSYKEKRELELLEGKIPELEAEKEEIEKTLYGNAPSGYTEVQKLSERLAEIEHEINASTERWLELAEIAS